MTIVIVFLTALTYQLVLTITRPMLPLYATELGASELTVGLLISAFAFFPMILAIHIGKMVDKIRSNLPVVFGIIGLTIGIAVPAFIPSIWALFISQTIVGVSQIFINVGLQNLVGSHSTPATRDKHFSYLSTGVSLGWFIGPVTGGYLGEFYQFQVIYTYTLFFGVLALIIGMFLPKGFSQNKGKPKTDNKKEGTFNLLTEKKVRRALITSALVLYSRDIFIAYFPIFASGQGYSTSEIGWIISIKGLALVLVRFSLPFLLDKLGRDRIIVFSLLMGGASFALYPILGHFYLFILLAVMMGAGLGCGQPLSMSIAYNAAPEARKAEVLGLRLSVNRASQVFAPVLFGLAGTIGGIYSVFYLSGIFLVSGAFYSSKTKGQGREEN
ncbi:Predicted arabinose efflux permease, MFS family [Salipaludibacillus aurantiacus]|uniref:Predicted arabinose efflux permease, MFS family n=1 Tax=Salipaludibacillus aurantiacus TaxID=1601833 RepID=A0A1H9W3W3_9BACI|nr:Predicted arabinose efflux permease, MFS family [Salipaludibacillus aurantiacus]